jgi:adenylate kinase
MRLIFLGPPGSGKGTQAKLLQRRLGAVPIGTGDILRDAIRRQTPLGKKVEAYLPAGLLVPDELVNAIVEERFVASDRPNSFVMDGYPRTVPQAVNFESVLRTAELGIDYVVLFTVPDAEVMRRLAGRRLAEKRRDDVDDTVRKRLVEYVHNTAPLIEHYRRQGILRDIDATADVETVYQSIVSLCGGGAGAPC